MFKVICSVLVLFFQLVSTTWGCNSTRLMDDVEAMHGRIWRGLDITEDHVRESLNFLWDKEEVRHYKDIRFPQTVEDRMSRIPNDYYHKFSGICKKIYEENDDETQIAVSIFFDRVSNEYEPYYHLQQELEKSKTVVENFDLEAYREKFRNRKKHIASQKKSDTIKKSNMNDPTSNGTMDQSHNTLRPSPIKNSSESTSVSVK